MSKNCQGIREYHRREDAVFPILMQCILCILHAMDRRVLNAGVRLHLFAFKISVDIS